VPESSDNARSLEETYVPPGTVASDASFPPLPPPRAASDAAPSKLASVESAAGQTIGDYEIVRILGQGGMGVVHLARQKQLDRLVALKVLTAGTLADNETRERFESEARIAAGLRHPNIVQVIELGQSESGPFIAMEYVPGQTLSAFQAGVPLTAIKAANLVHDLALAVQYAHEQGIIHRDLKPANILLGADHRPRITDFGLAKNLQSENGQTRTGEIMGTPAYMAPEQASGATRLLGPSCDVYALGVILYELLTGGPPFRGTDPVATVLAVLSNDPVSVRKLVNTVPRDLDTICLKCLEKQPSQRYASASQLAEDLQRFLDGRPILARPPSMIDRLWKLTRRYPLAASLSLALCIAVVSFLVFAVWKTDQLTRSLAATQQAQQRSERNFRNALEAAQRRIERSGEDPRQLLTEELEFFNSIRHQADTDPTSRYESALAARSAGDVLRKLDQKPQALEAYQEAEFLLKELSGANPATLIYQRDLAGIYNQMGLVQQDDGRLDLAESSLKQGLSVFEELARQDPGDPDFVRQQATVWNNLGVLAGQRMDPQKAEQCFGNAVKLRTALLAEDPRHAEYQSELIDSQSNLATALARQKKLKDATQLLQDVVRRHTELPEALQRRSQTRYSRASAHLNLGGLFDQQGDKAAAIREDSEGIVVLQALSQDYPQVPSYQQATAEAELNLGKVWLSQEKLAESVKLFESAQSRFRSLSKAYPQAPQYQQMVDRLEPGIQQLRDAIKEAAQPPPPQSLPPQSLPPQSPQVTQPMPPKSEQGRQN
jgi:tetratricopeptide (TPR) repeat protein/predicted Ser/Thr protein kinase